MRLAVKALLDYDGPAYMRLGRLAVETVTDQVPGYRFELGKGATLQDGKDVTRHRRGHDGADGPEGRRTAGSRRACPSGSSTCTPSSPWTRTWCLQAAQETGLHRHHRGDTTSWAAWARRCASTCPACCPVPVVRHGVMDEFGRSGKAPAVLEAYGITPEEIAKCAKKAISMKK